ncbi:MAG: methionine--tRNA ligase subunit beta, partial [Terriglobales bacterium]
RYFLLREVSFGQDGNFSHRALVERYNADLANGWGNLASRTLAMIHKYRGGVVPPRRRQAGPRPPAESIGEEFARQMETWQFSRALEAVWSLIAQTDRFLSAARPWDLAKGEADQQHQLDDVLRDGYEVLRFTAVLLAAILPESAEKLWRQLGLAGSAHRMAYASLRWDEIPPGQRLGPSEPLFPRAEKEKTMEELKSLEAAPAAPVTVEADDGRIAIDDFAKVDMRVGTVLTAERIEKADKLLRLTVDIGSEVRQIVAGIAKSYAPEELVARKVVIVANLASRKLRGIESNGMIVAATLPDGSAALVAVPPEAPNGARLK